MQRFETSSKKSHRFLNNVSFSQAEFRWAFDQIRYTCVAVVENQEMSPFVFQHVASAAWWAVILLIILSAGIIASFTVLTLHEPNKSFLTFQVRKTFVVRTTLHVRWAMGLISCSCVLKPVHFLCRYHSFHCCQQSVCFSTCAWWSTCPRTLGFVWLFGLHWVRI